MLCATKIGSVTLPHPIILAPLAGYTDTAFRRVARSCGAGLLVTEMVSAAGLVRNGKRTRLLLAHHPEEQPLSMQIFGRNPEEMAEAGRILVEHGAAIVDINMGCPVKRCVATGPELR